MSDQIKAQSPVQKRTRFSELPEVFEYSGKKKDDNDSQADSFLLDASQPFTPLDLQINNKVQPQPVKGRKSFIMPILKKSRESKVHQEEKKKTKQKIYVNERKSMPQQITCKKINEEEEVENKKQSQQKKRASFSRQQAKKRITLDANALINLMRKCEQSQPERVFKQPEIRLPPQFQIRQKIDEVIYNPSEFFEKQYEIDRMLNEALEIFQKQLSCINKTNEEIKRNIHKSQEQMTKSEKICKKLTNQISQMENDAHLKLLEKIEDHYGINVLRYEKEGTEAVGNFELDELLVKIKKKKNDKFQIKFLSKQYDTCLFECYLFNLDYIKAILVSYYKIFLKDDEQLLQTIIKLRKAHHQIQKLDSEIKILTPAYEFSQFQLSELPEKIKFRVCLGREIPLLFEINLMEFLQQSPKSIEIFDLTEKSYLELKVSQNSSDHFLTNIFKQLIEFYVK